MPPTFLSADLNACVPVAAEGNPERVP